MEKIIGMRKHGVRSVPLKPTLLILLAFPCLASAATATEQAAKQNQIEAPIDTKIETTLESDQTNTRHDVPGKHQLVSSTCDLSNGSMKLEFHTKENGKLTSVRVAMFPKEFDVSVAKTGHGQRGKGLPFIRKKTGNTVIDEIVDIVRLFNNGWVEFAGSYKKGKTYEYEHFRIDLKPGQFEKMFVRCLTLFKNKN